MERPILMSGPLVRETIAGRKTQTRRWLKRSWLAPRDPFEHEAEMLAACPYGQVGDRLWVRETWAPRDAQALHERDRRQVFYRADDKTHYETDGRWTPSIHMPRWASRLSMTIAEVRFQLLQNITDEDAVAEGVGCWVCGRLYDGLSEDDCECFHSTGMDGRASARDSFAVLWDEINGRRVDKATGERPAWDANPFVWVIRWEPESVEVLR